MLTGPIPYVLLFAATVPKRSVMLSDSNQFYLEEDFLAGHGQSKSFRTSFRVGGSCFCCDRSYRNQPAAPGILNDTTSM